MGERMGFGFGQNRRDIQNRRGDRWIHIATHTWYLRDGNGRRSGRGDSATGVICGCCLKVNRRRVRAHQWTMRCAMFHSRHVQPARAQRRQWHRQRNQYETQGDEFEPPRHVLILGGLSRMGCDRDHSRL